MEGREGRVFPIILSQATDEYEEEDEDEDQCPRDVIKIGDMSDFIFIDMSNCTLHLLLLH